MNRSYLRRIYVSLAGAILLVVTLGLAANAFFSQITFEKALAPDMVRKVAVSGASTRSLILEAMQKNIALSEIYGIEQTFDELKESMRDIAFVAITDTKGSVLTQRFTAPDGARSYFASTPVLDQMNGSNAAMAVSSARVGDQIMVSMPIVAAQGAVGTLHIGVSVDFVNRIITDMLFDVLVVLVVSLFFTLELLHFMAGRRIESALTTLGNVLERGATGDFTTTKAVVPGAMFGTIVQRLEAMRARVNESYARLAHQVDDAMRGPTHERPSGLDSVRTSMQSLGASYQFGVAEDTGEQEKEQRLAKVRAPLFLFILAEEMTRPFLPGYVKDLLVSIPWITPQVMVGLPIVLFMLIVAFGQPFMAYYTEKLGSRRVMVVGAAVAAVGFVASAMASSVLDLLVWRSFCAVGYGLVFVAAQAHVLEYSTAKTRARSFAVFIGAIMVATVCGPSIGGILADNMGERQTFLVSALLAAGSIFLIRTMPDRQAQAEDAAPARLPKWSEMSALIFNARFMTVTGLAAMPAKMLLTGVCFYLMPLYLLSIGSTQAVAGRALMAYGVVMVIMMPVSAMLANTRQRMEWLVGAGLVVSGLGGLLLLIDEGAMAVVAAVALIGFGQSFSIAAQSALVREHCEIEVAKMGETAVYGVYRLLERLGNALGPVVAAFLVHAVGYRSAFVACGVAVLVCGLMFFALTRALQGRPLQVQPAGP